MLNIESDTRRNQVLPIDPKLEEVFTRYDVDDSGTMDQKELKAALTELNVKNLSQKEVNSIFLSVDTDRNDKLSLEEFASIFGKAKLRSVFCEIDQEDQNGKISVKELQRALAKLGYEHFSTSQIQSLLKQVDKDASGEIDFDEFQEFFQYVPATSLAILAKSWVEGISFDCGSDLSPPIASPDVPWHYVVLGGLGGVASRTLTAPLEKVKITAQITGKSRILGELKQTYSALGVRGLFAGNLTNCLRVFPYAGIVTYSYLHFLPFTPADKVLDPMEPVYRGTCAVSAGIIGQLLTYPMDVIRSRMTLLAKNRDGAVRSLYNGAVECSSEIISKEGPRGLYKGLTPTVFAVAPFLAMQMSTADALKSLCSEKNVEITTPIMACIGGTAGIVAQTFVYPLDVLRRRLQVQSNTGNDSVLAAMRKIVQKDGVRSLFAGIGATYLKVFPAVAIAMTCTKEMIGYSKRNWE